jgi:hypothetical protein
MVAIDEALVGVAEAIRARGDVPEDVIVSLERLRGAVRRWVEGARSPLYAPAHGRWLVSPSGTHVDLTRRPTLQRLLRALVAARMESPGTAISSADLVAAGWTGEGHSEASANRLRVAICRLRQLGLEDVLVTTGVGWMLDPNVALCQDEAPSAEDKVRRSESGFYARSSITELTQPVSREENAA